MSNPLAKNPERVEHSTPESRDTAKKPDSKELKEIGTGVSEVVGGLDVAEVSDNEVSESESSGKSRLGGGSIKTGTGGDLKAVKPVAPVSLEVMRTQISVKVKKEIAVLQKEAAIATRNFDPEKLNSIVSRIRSLREILANLAYASTEAIKTWWLKMVKDNSV